MADLNPKHIACEVQQIATECTLALCGGMYFDHPSLVAVPRDFCGFSRQVGSDPAKFEFCGAPGYKECVHCGVLCKEDWDKGCSWQAQHEEVR